MPQFMTRDRTEFVAGLVAAAMLVVALAAFAYYLATTADVFSDGTSLIASCASMVSAAAAWLTARAATRGGVRGRDTPRRIVVRHLSRFTRNRDELRRQMRELEGSAREGRLLPQVTTRAVSELANDMRDQAIRICGMCQTFDTNVTRRVPVDEELRSLRNALADIAQVIGGRTATAFDVADLGDHALVACHRFEAVARAAVGAPPAQEEQQLLRQPTAPASAPHEQESPS